MDATAMSEETKRQTSKRSAIIVLISQKREAESKTAEELETEIRKVLEEGLAKIQWLVLENVTIVQE